MGHPWAPLPYGAGDRYMRILQPKPGALNEYILTVHRLNESPDFYALSYCWGTEGETQHILCDGQKLPVTPHLRGALDQLAKLGYDALWIDAICINQDDVNEKSHQVSFMGEIYQQAKGAVVWLGPAGPDQDQIVEYVYMLSSVYNYHIINHPEENLTQNDLPLLGLPAWNDQDEPLLKPVADFFQLPWWSRAWVIQEFALAEDVTFVQGNVRLEWRTLVNALSSLERIVPFNQYRTSRWRRCIQLGLSRAAVQTADLDIIDLFKSHQHKMCKDERDHVFALLGILTEGAKHAGWNLTIQPDYQATVLKVYTAMASDILRNTPNLDMLCLLRWSDRPELGLPSWVPDFGTTLQKPRIFEELRESRWAASSSSQLVFKIDGESLRLQIQPFDKIEAISVHIPDADLLENQIHDRKGRLEVATNVGAVLKSRMQACPKKRGQYVTGESTTEVVAKTFFLRFLPQMDDWSLFAWQSAEIAFADAESRIVNGDFDAAAVDQQVAGHLSRNLVHLWHLATSSVMARTRRGYYCWVPYQTEPGDDVVLAAGSGAPLVIRRHGPSEDQRNQMLGGCYVHGIMYGEAWNPDKLQDMWFD